MNVKEQSQDAYGFQVITHVERWQLHPWSIVASNFQLMCMCLLLTWYTFMNISFVTATLQDLAKLAFF